ncbi:acyltransferase family protein [Leifsonia sp. NPDC077715]|uniref:acyltransferase family protein n=1 Tax=Leifsonia sp. NPDC077715 TaxID=3155539 RepID=UPI00341C9B65
MSGSRSVGVDALRVVGVTAVVYTHVFGADPLRDVLFAWHVPLFFVVTGYLWRPGRSIGGEVRRRAGSLLVPYVAWLVIVMSPLVGDLLLRGQASFPIESALRGGTALGGQFAAFWFVTALFVAAVVARLLENLPPWLQWCVPLAALVSLWVFRLPLHKAPLSAGTALACLVFVLAGRLLVRYRQRIPYPTLTGALLAAAGLAAVAARLVPPVDLKRADTGLPAVTVVVSFAICAGLILVAERLFAGVNGRLGHGISRLAVPSLMVVLTHAVVIQAWRVGGAPPSALVFVTALIVPWMLALLVHLTPASRLLTGAPQWRITRSSAAARHPQEGHRIGPAPDTAASSPP